MTRDSNPWSDSIKNYLVLTANPNLLVSAQIEESRLLISRYYWLKKFYFQYSRIHGMDAGIEQQISSLIETISDRIKDFDWNVLQKINENIESVG